MGTRTVTVRLMNLSGDSLAELETGFLHEFLPLFQVSGGVPRAEVESVRVGSIKRFVDYLTFGNVEIIHLSSHGSKKWMQVGESNIRLREFRRQMADSPPINAVVLNTSCELATPKWVDAFKEAGAIAYIAAKRQTYAKDAAVFAASYFAAYFGTIHKGKSQHQRAFDAYRLAHAAYESFVPTSSRAQYYWHSNEPVRGRRVLPAIKLK
jgi:hypothetical protein